MYICDLGLHLDQILRWAISANLFIYTYWHIFQQNRLDFFQIVNMYVFTLWYTSHIYPKSILLIAAIPQLNELNYRKCLILHFKMIDLKIFQIIPDFWIIMNLCLNEWFNNFLLMAIKCHFILNNPTVRIMTGKLLFIAICLLPIYVETKVSGN